MACSTMTLDELNKAALDQFVYQPVTRDMVSYLAQAARNVIACDSTLVPASPWPKPPPSHNNHSLPPTPPRSPDMADDARLPSLDAFITQLVVSSNVQVPTLMSTLVYLGRLKSKLQPMARGLRCTTHRIFLASLILAAKYLNDSSPKNKHWASYTRIAELQFGFGRTEVNLMEKQLLFLLDWELRITDQDLYRHLDFFLHPLRLRIAERHARKVRHRDEKRRHHDAAYARYPSPVSSRASSRSRHVTPDLTTRHLHDHGHAATPPGLTYSSSASSCGSVTSLSYSQHSRSATPPDPALYDSPVQLVVVDDAHQGSSAKRLLSYDSIDQYPQLSQDSGKKRSRRGMWGRLLAGAVAVR
ncbi:hypothetical protein CDD82_689 [Ophiocordyceps australis]|uniref:Cyclin N-terminal domain-containing protein n=1 Tax=Ophiocordyceps australis TaxID=1399860 RepID=A0A2C5YFH5_9HYPO|nr:hypothetical protein CDD82_689 [Ophiocordyceps australis]